ncbi:39485_t:CDS:2 [Gigaspora margarita]|uniref:39485_t:CDS:1 n=1 Tax=Gigaspora margarita TaxID=4874 RepID=A0ABN7VCK1_GIGMA|nr:39485_t:CDS:2 [Gigaspora margarita]
MKLKENIKKGTNKILPENPTPLEKSKHELCREILLYQRKHKLTDEELAQQMELTLAETEDILYYRIAYFTLDRLMTYANKLFKLEPLTVGKITKITITSHYQIEHKDVMTNEKILEIVRKLDGEIMKPEPKKKPT